MSLEPPTMWIEKRGRQHRVYWRNAPDLGLPARSYYGRLYTRGQAEVFISMAAHLGVEAACRVMDAPDKATRQARIATSLDQRDLVPADPSPALAAEPLTPGGPPPLFTLPTGAQTAPRLTGAVWRSPVRC